MSGRWLAPFALMVATLAIAGLLVATAHAFQGDYPAATFFLLTAVVNHHIAREAIREHEARRRP